MRRLLLLSMVVLMLGVVVMGVACGAKSDSTKINDAVKGYVSAYNSQDYDKCLTYMTDYGDATQAKATLQYARQLSGEITLGKVENITVTGSTATASITVTVMGQSSTSTKSFKKVGSDWKVVGLPTG